MSPGTYNPPEYIKAVMPLWEKRDELEARLAKTAWWRFLKRANIKSDIYEINSFLFSYGMDQAFEDLEKCGLVKRI